MSVLALDTSNYTTSVAVFDGHGGQNEGRLLQVRPGELGLRQSDALFQHVKQLPELFCRLEEQGALKDIQAVGASTRPRAVEGSYMPCFLAGASQGEALARTLGVSFYEFSHQQGHIAAAAWSAGRMDILDTPHLAWHLSGGTTELLYVEPWDTAVKCKIIGGTTDVSAGQLIDRTGQLLGLQFPSGKAIDALAAKCENKQQYNMKLNGLTFSLSGVEHKMKQMFERGEAHEDIAYFALASVISGVERVTKAAVKEYGNMPVLYSGGVASNSLLRELMPGGIFAKPQFSTDNAMGTAILTYRAVKKNG